MNAEAVRLETKFRRRGARVGVIGLGYVGLPLVKTFLERGFSVTGFDIDDIAAGGATVGTFVSVDAQTYTAVITPELSTSTWVAASAWPSAPAP